MFAYLDSTAYTELNLKSNAGNKCIYLPKFTKFGVANVLSQS